MPSPHIAYVFERFPTFTQTFCVREILELERLGVQVQIFSIHDTREESIRHFPAELMDRVHFLPKEECLIELIKQWKESKLLPQSVVLTLRQWGDRPDKMRVYEAAYISHVLKKMGSDAPWHTHSHFAGIGARTCWWLRKFHGTSFSFTAHANDIFCNQSESIPSCGQLIKDASLVVTVSDFTARQLREKYPDAAHRVRRVYNGLDLEPFMAARASAERSKAPGGILSVGRLIEKKGYDDLITACGLLRDRGVPFNCRIVGEGPREAQLKSQITRLGLEDRVTLTGPLPMPTIIQLLAEETQVFALACKTEHDGGKDNLPTVLMEAMAARLPCVSTRLAGVPEMVLDGVNGLISEEGQPQAFADHLETLLKDPARCETMGQAGLEHAKKHFAKETTSRHLLKAFAEKSGMRFEAALAARHGLLLGYSKRLLSALPQLRHHVEKARDKTFDLELFMGSAHRQPQPR